jgi:hypothetical protein
MSEPPRNPYGPPQPGGYGPPQPQRPPQQGQRPPQQPPHGQGYNAPPPASYEPYRAPQPVGPHPAEDLPLAAFGPRARARLIDFGIVFAAGFAVIFPIVLGAIGVPKEGEAWAAPILWTTFFVAAVLPFLYEAIQLALWGQTIGKRQIGLRVVLADPAGAALPITTAVWRAAINNLGYQLGIFLFLLLGVKVWSFFLFFMFVAIAGLVMAYLWAIWDRPLYQAIHDRYAGTVVVDEQAEW